MREERDCHLAILSSSMSSSSPLMHFSHTKKKKKHVQTPALTEASNLWTSKIGSVSSSLPNDKYPLPDFLPYADQTDSYIRLFGFLSEMYLCLPVSQDQHKALSVWSF